MALEGLYESVLGIGESIVSIVTEKPIVSAAAGIGVVGATALGVAALSKPRKKAKKKTKKGRARDRKFKSKQKHEQKYKRKKKYKVYGKKGYIYPKKKRSGKKKLKRLVKGSKEAKAYMAKIRRMKK